MYKCISYKASFVLMVIRYTAEAFFDNYPDFSHLNNKHPSTCFISLKVNIDMSIKTNCKLVK